MQRKQENQSQENSTGEGLPMFEGVSKDLTQGVVFMWNSELSL
jgi:hypothetical protein